MYARSQESRVEHAAARGTDRKAQGSRLSESDVRQQYLHDSGVVSGEGCCGTGNRTSAGFNTTIRAH